MSQRVTSQQKIQAQPSGLRGVQGVGLFRGQGLGGSRCKIRFLSIFEIWSKVLLSTGLRSLGFGDVKQHVDKPELGNEQCCRYTAACC